MFGDRIPIIIAVAAVTVLIFLAIGIVVGKAVQAAKTQQIIKTEREKAVKKSREILGGQFGEQIAPFLPNFPCNPGDCKFLGQPVDFIAFPGSAEGKSVDEVLFIEVKSGRSQLSEREKQIRSAIKNGRVRYIEYRLP
ncbi:MAG: Holliday junction resolvase [Treponema sp.]|nr:Holliday junction resolvase [Treponema sp.]